MTGAPLTPTAIETTYADTRFRSRLEARWAVFFDLVGWPWLYEPLDLDGYIPDFVLQFHRPLLIEVKPAVVCADLTAHTAKIEVSGWRDDALVVGAALWKHAVCCDELQIGLLGEALIDGFGWGPGVLFRCGQCRAISIYHEERSSRCRVRGCHDGDDHLGYIAADLLTSLWAEAGNVVRWRPQGDRIPRRGCDLRIGLAAEEGR